MKGKTADPRMSTLKTIAAYFNVSLDELCFDKDFLESKEATSTGKSVPILSWADCLTASETKLNITPDNWSHWVVVSDDTNADKAYGLTTKPSMKPCFPTGTILIVSEDITPIDGDFVIVKHKGADEATVKELSLDGLTKLLLPLNENSIPEALDSTTKVIGTVIESRFLYQTE
jgi:SOS-response transcriptional repressor LexA